MYKEATYNLHMIMFYAGKGVPEGNLLIRRNSSQNIAKACTYYLIGEDGCFSDCNSDHLWWKYIMPGPFSNKNLISIRLDYIQKRRGTALFFSFEYNLLPNLISNFNHYMDSATG